MSRVDRKFIKVKNKESKKCFKKGIEHLFPSCPRCGSPLTSGFGNESGDWFLCKNCGEEVPFESIEE
jgi:uncharacterized Zn finger protein (UPF0148 family)